MGESTANTAKSLKDRRTDPSDAAGNGAGRGAGGAYRAPGPGWSPGALLHRLRTPRRPGSGSNWC